VLDADTEDFKDSAKRYLDRADAVLVTGGNLQAAAWDGISLKLVERARQFMGGPGNYCPSDLVEFVRERLAEMVLSET